MEYTVSSKTLKLTVTDQGGTMRSIVYLPTGEERQWQGGEHWSSRDVAIFPIIGHAGAFTVSGQKYELKSHGVVRYATLALEKLSANSVTLALTSDHNTRENYPFDFEYKVTYTVIDDKIQVEYFVKSLSGNMPFYVGGHPGMKAPGGSAEIEFENEESPVMYPLETDGSVKIERLKSFIADKPFFAKCKTFQLGGLSGGAIYAHTQDGYTYEYKSNCPLFAFWSNENGGDYICVEPWWGINDFASAPRELFLKPFINFDDGKGQTFTYTLSIKKH
jgi:galactose mutarotase-like enzyme